MINKQIAEMSTYSLFVGIMWNRLGTPTPRADSGTVEEFELAATAYLQHGQPDIWFYFREAAVKLDTIEQIDQRKKVLLFKEKLRKNGSTSSYKNTTGFKELLRNHLTLWLNNLISAKSNAIKVKISADIEPHPTAENTDNRLKHMLMALLHAAEYTLEQEVLLFGAAKSETMAEHARLKYEVSKLT